MAFFIVAVLTCFNRREKTIRALEALWKANSEYNLKAVLVDDGSSDGTGDAVSSKFDWVEVVHSPGNLYWCGGMRLAMSVAMDKKPDFILWLNDDTILFKNALESLVKTSISTSMTKDKFSIVVGAVCDNNGRVSYGGRVRTSRLFPTRFSLIEPSQAPSKCDAMNGNCVLIPRNAYERVGNLDARYVHAIGDIDYALRAKKLGVEVWVAPNFVGECINDNVAAGTFNDKTLPLKARWSHLVSPKALPPSSWAAFCSSHCGIFWPIAWGWPYLKVVLSGLFRRQYTDSV